MAAYENGSHVIVNPEYLQCDNESMASVSTGPGVDVSMNMRIKGDCAGHIHTNVSQVCIAHCTAHVQWMPSTARTYARAHTPHPVRGERLAWCMRCIYAVRCAGGGLGFVALQVRVGNFAFQIHREISHANFGVLREFLAHQQYTLWTLAGGTTQNPGGSATFPTAKFTSANLTRRGPPRPHPPTGAARTPPPVSDSLSS